MFEDGIVKVRQRGFDPETSMYCFGGGGGGGSTQKEPEKTGGTAPVATPNYTRTLPNGVVVEDYSRPYNQMPSAPSPAPSQTARQGFYEELATNLPDMGVVPQRQQTRVGEIISASPMDMFNNAPVTAGQAFNEALAPGQISGGRIGVGEGFSVGKVPGGYGIQYDRTFAQGGPVTAGIGSLGLPQAMFKSTKS
jgi:hypothetical protein